MGSSEVEVAVLGAGIAGLATALELRAAGAEVAVLEAASTAGGVLSTERIRGFTIERGPNLFRVPAAADAFLVRHGLADRLVAAGPEAGLRSLLVGGRLVTVPGSVAGAVATPLLSARGKLRLLAEPLVPRGDARNESVAEFVARRLGREALERVVAPALVGVYAGDETRLGAEAVFPALTGYERSRGSIVRGAVAAALAARRAGAPRPRRGSWSTREGTAGLARAMADRLGGALELRCGVRAVTKEGGGFAIETDAGVRRARRVVVALPASRAADVLRALDAELAAGLAAIEYAPLASVALGLDPGTAREPVRGIGFLVPRAEGLDLLGALFPSRVFPDRAPPGRELAAALLGGTRWPGAVDAPDDALLARAHAGLERALGLREAPELLSVARWPHAVPQPGREHPRLVADLRARAARLGPVRLAGGYLDGVAVADALLSGARAAS